jgi:adenylyltransferase/sulfurtransferase
MDRGEDFLLVDVREPAEYEIVSIPGAVLIPKGDILNGSALRSCRRTRRSSCTARAACARPRRSRRSRPPGSKNSVHVQGGVLAWAAQVDPSLPTY